MLDEGGGDGDFDRVSGVVKFWIEEVLGGKVGKEKGSGKGRWEWVEEMFREAEWREVRKRMRTTGEAEDASMGNMAIR